MSFSAIMDRLTRRGQRIAFLCVLAPFYIGFVVGWMQRKPAPLFIGAAGLAITFLAYRAHVRRHPPSK